MILKGFWFSIESTCSSYLLWLNRVLYGSGVTKEKTMRVTVFLFWGDMSGETALGVAVLYTCFWHQQT